VSITIHCEVRKLRHREGVIPHTNYYAAFLAVFNLWTGTARVAVGNLGWSTFSPWGEAASRRAGSEECARARRETQGFDHIDGRAEQPRDVPSCAPSENSAKTLEAGPNIPGKSRLKDLAHLLDPHQVIVPRFGSF